MQDVEKRRKALENALSKTEDLIDLFSKTVRKDWESEPSKSDFSKTVEKLIPQAVQASEIPIRHLDEDVRLSTDLNGLKNDCLSCKRCRLCQTRTNTVFGEGCEDRPDVFVVGEGPGETEDKTGRPFTGKAGELLEKMLAAISLFRTENCYISNVVKCRPPENRDPMPDEKNICGVYLKQQILLLRPKAILCLGKNAANYLTGEDNSSMTQLRGRFFFYERSIPLISTYHPAAVLRNPELKRPVWEDLKKLATFLNLDIAGGSR